MKEPRYFNKKEIHLLESRTVFCWRGIYTQQLQNGI